MPDQRLRDEQCHRMQPGDIQCDPADSPVLRQCEEAPVRNAMSAQRIEVENERGCQRRVSRPGPYVPDQAARCGRRQHQERGEHDTRDEQPAQMRRK